MSQRPGAHTCYARENDVVVEWYDFGDHAPYESANLLTFDPAAQASLAKAIGLTALPSPPELAELLASRLGSYFEVRALVDAHGVPYRHQVNFTP